MSSNLVITNGILTTPGTSVSPELAARLAASVQRIAETTVRCPACGSLAQKREDGTVFPHQAYPFDRGCDGGQ